jgi:hypothetical protein
MGPITALVLSDALAQCAAWRRAGSFFGQRKELERWDDAQSGMDPAEQALDGHDLAGPQIELWLVVQHELPFVDRGAQFVQ